MRSHISYTVLSVALVAGAAAANAQTVVTREIVDQPVETVITQQPDSMVVAQQPVLTVPGTVVTEPVAAAPVETVETVRTVRSTTTSPRPRIVRRHVVRSGTVNRVTTTRTTVTKRVVRVRAVVAAPALEAITQPPYTEVVEGPAVVASPAYPERLFDAAVPPAAPAVAPVTTFGAGTAVPTYRYVYEPDRILVIDPYTNIAVQSIPR